MKEIDVFYVFDKDDNFINTVTNINEYVHKKQTSNIGELKISSPINSDFVKYNKIGFENEGKFYLFEIDSVETEFYEDEKSYEVIALEDIITLRNNIIEERRMRDSTIREGLEKALEGTNYKIGHIDDNKELRTYNYYFNNSLECFNIVLQEYKMEFVTRIELRENNKLEKFVDIYFRVGRDTGLRFTYDINLQMLERNESNIPHYNVLYGFGKSLETDAGGFSRKLTFDSVNNGKKYIEDAESILKYGKRVGKFEDGKIEDASELLKATTEKLREIKDLQYTYRATVKEVSDFFNMDHFDVFPGDYIVVADEERGNVFKARVAEITYIKDSRGILNKSFVLGALTIGLFDDEVEDKLNDLNDRLDNVENKELPPIDEQYPNAVPPKSNLKVKGLYSSIAIEWTFENKAYFTYELYASKQNNFVPQPTDLIFKGQASAYLHQVKPGETWYYRVRCINSYGATNEFSAQVTGYSAKVADGTEFFENASIVHALIQSVDADTITVGKLKGHRIDAKELSVEDGNGNQTLYIDSWGNVILNVKQLKILGKDVVHVDEVIKKINDAIREFNVSVDDRFADASQSLADLEGYMEGAFYDGVINASEAKSLRGLIERLEQEKLVTNKEFDNIYNNKYLDQDHKNMLFNVKQGFNAATTEYTGKIKQVISSETVTSEDRAELDTLGNKYRSSIERFKDALTQCIDNITTNRVGELDYATTEHFVEMQTNIDGINNTVKKNTNDIVNIDGEVQKRLLKTEFTTFKQETDKFKLDIEKGYGGDNYIKNSGFLNGYAHYFITEYQWNGVNSSVNVWGDESEWVMNGTKALVIKGTNGTRGAYGIRQEGIKLKPNTTYTLSGYAAAHRGKWRISLAQNDWAWIASSRGNSSGGKSPRNWDRFSITFTTGSDHNYLTSCKLDLMLEEAGNDAHAWFTGLVLNEGAFALRWHPKMGEIYSNKVTIDLDSFSLKFENGDYALMGRNGLEMQVNGMTHPYHALFTQGVVNHLDFPPGGGREYRIVLPNEFRGKKFKVQTHIQGWNFFDQAVARTMASGHKNVNHSAGTFDLYFNNGLNENSNVNISYTVIA